MKRRGSAAKRHPERLIWLNSHPEFTRHLPGINQDVDDAGRIALDTCAREMYAAGLFEANGKSASLENRRTIVRRLISELRGEHIAIGLW